MEIISNESDRSNKAISHELKIKINDLVKKCKAEGIPMFISYYIPNEGYIYNGVFPEEIATDNVKSEYWRFAKFLETCITFNKADFKPIIRQNTKEHIEETQDALNS